MTQCDHTIRCKYIHEGKVRQSIPFIRQVVSGGIEPANRVEPSARNYCAPKHMKRDILSYSALCVPPLFMLDLAHALLESNEIIAP